MKYKECIFDIEMAIESGYPMELQHTLYLTKGQAYTMDRQQVKGIECFEKALQLFENNCCSEQDKKEVFLNQVRLTIEATKKKAKNTAVVEYLNPVGSVKVWNQTPCKCSKEDIYCEDVYCGLLGRVVDIGYSKTHGRGIFLKKSVKQFETIFFEKSCVSTVGTISNDLKCHGCMKNLATTFIPCNGCTEAFYCTKQCFDKAWANWHRFECGYTDSLRVLKIFARMAYRVFVQTLPSDIIGVLKDLGKAVEYAKAGKDLTGKLNLPMEGFKNGVYQVNTYYALFHLDAGTRNHDLEYNKKALEICLKLVMLYESKCTSLGVTDDWDLNLVGLDGEVTSTEKRVLQMTILFHHYKQWVNQNMMKLFIKELGSETSLSNLIWEEHCSRMGPGRVFPIGSLINHAHLSNLSLSFGDDGEYCFYRAFRDMEPGEQLTYDYDHCSDILVGAALTFACQCHLCEVFPGETDEDLCFGAKHIYCENCCLIIMFSSDIFCEGCCNQGYFIREKVYKRYLKGVELARSGRNEAAIQRFLACLTWRSEKDITIFSSLQLMSWVCLALLYKKAGSHRDVIKYATLVLDAFDRYRRISTYRFMGVAFRLLAEALPLEISRCQALKITRKVESKQLEGVLKREPSGCDFSVMHDGFSRGGIRSTMSAKAFSEFLVSMGPKYYL